MVSFLYLQNCKLFTLKLAYTKRFLYLFSLFIFISGGALEANFQTDPSCPDTVIDDGLGNTETITIDCNYPLENNCITLQANYTTIKQSNTYTVTSIPYAPIYPFTGLTRRLNITVDDIWGPYESFPGNFDFCFFNQFKNKFQVGSNGILSFKNNGNFCSYSLYSNDLIPNSYIHKDAIMLFQDLDPRYSRSVDKIEIGYQIMGTFPCRALVVSFANVPHYKGATDSHIDTTFQMVLYESTNVIEVYVLKKPNPNTVLPGYSFINSGRAVLGIHRNDGNAAYTPPFRNTGTWSAFNEAYRFTPNGAPVPVSFKWFKDGVLQATTQTLEVCPEENETYTVEVQYTICTGNIITVQDVVNVVLDPQTYDLTFNELPTIACGTEGLPTAAELPETSLENATGDWTMQDNMNGTYTYIFTPDNNNCYPAPFTYLVTVVNVNTTDIYYD